MSTASIEHKKARVVYVDDFPPALEQFRRQFADKFGSIECLSPDVIDREIGKVTNADLLVCDLKLTSPVEDGNRRVRYSDGVSLLKSLGNKCPPAMILTGSISGHSVARLTSQSADSEGNVAFRVALKSAPQEALLAQMVGAIRDAQRISPEKRAIVLSELDVSEKELTKPDTALQNSASRVLERVQAYIKGYSELIGALRAEYNLCDWPCWQSSGRMLEQQLDTLKKLNSKVLCGNGAEDLLSSLHDLRARVVILDPDFLKLPNESRDSISMDKHILQMLSALKTDHNMLSRVIQDTYKQAYKFCNPVYEFERQMQKLFAADLDNNFYYQDPAFRGKIKISDPGRNIEQLFQKMAEIFSDSSSDPQFTYMAENLSYPNRLEQCLRDKLNWGTGMQVRIRTFNSDFESRQWGEILDPARDFMQRLVAAKVFYAEPAKFSRTYDYYADNTFEFYIKVSDLDRQAYDREQQRLSSIIIEKKDKFEMYDETIEVQYIKVPSGNIIVIDEDFESRDLSHAGGDYSLLEYQDQLILTSSSNGHAKNDLLFCYFLVKCMGLSADDAYSLVFDSVRIKAEQSNFNFATTDQELLSRLKPILSDLGVKEVRANPQAFFSRSYLDRFMIFELEDLN